MEVEKNPSTMDVVAAGVRKRSPNSTGNTSITALFPLNGIVIFNLPILNYRDYLDEERRPRIARRRGNKLHTFWFAGWRNCY
jgi:hypothetical protein